MGIERYDIDSSILQGELVGLGYSEDEVKEIRNILEQFVYKKKKRQR